MNIGVHVSFQIREPWSLGHTKPSRRMHIQQQSGLLCYRRKLQKEKPLEIIKSIPSPPILQMVRLCPEKGNDLPKVRYHVPVTEIERRDKSSAICQSSSHIILGLYFYTPLCTGNYKTYRTPFSILALRMELTKPSHPPKCSLMLGPIPSPWPVDANRGSHFAESATRTHFLPGSCLLIF